MAKLTEDDIKLEATGVVLMQQELELREQEIMQNEEFRTFLQLQRDVNKKAEELWAGIERHMIDNGIKNVKGDWGSLTIAERHSWITTNELPKKFTKVVADTKKLTDTFKLEGKEPKGAHLTYKYNLVKRLT